MGKHAHYIKQLERRADHLARRIAEGPRGKSFSYDKSELNALNWAIRQLALLQERKGALYVDMLEDVRHQKL